MEAVVDIRPVGPDELADLAQLFGGQRNTSRCWCMAFCVGRIPFAAGWFGGGNRRRFQAMTEGSATPMGVLASEGEVPVGWCACGPRSRYASGPDSLLIRHATAADDAWLAPCLFVRSGSRGQGLTHALLRGAVELARREGAAAIEGWPLAQTVTGVADAFVGREQVFADLGFHCVDRPTPKRVLMRLELGPA